MIPIPDPPTRKAALLPDVFCWSKMGYDARQPLPVILRRKDHERRYGEGKVWWGVGEGNLQRRICALLGRCGPDGRLVILTPQPTPSPVGNGQVVVWRDYLDQRQALVKIPPHALVLSAAATGKGKPKTKYFALVFESDVALTEASGGVLYRDQWRNIGSKKETFGGSQVTTVVERKSPEPASPGKPYKIQVRARLVEPFLAQLANPRCLTENELQRADEAGKRTFAKDEWLELVRSIRDGS
jgi:hypothetical protein